MVRSDELDINDFKDYREFLEAKRELEEQERLQFLKDTREKVYKCNDGEFHYRLLVLRVCQRYKLSLEYVPDAVYIVVNDYIEKMDDISFEEYLCGPSAPLIRPVKEVRKIFHEFSFLKTDKEIVDLANKVYGLNLKIVSNGSYESPYLFSESFSFESFTPINIDEVKTLKDELTILKKYDASNKAIQELKDKINGFGLSNEILELI